MKYEYPKISNMLTYRRIDADTVEITDDLTDNRYTVSIEEARFLRRLDGYTRPCDIKTSLNKTEIKEILDFIYDYELIRESDVMNIALGTKAKTLFVPKHTPFLKLMALVCNVVLMVSWLPVLFIGIKMFLENSEYMSADGAFWGIAIGVVCGMMIHELGHAFAGIAYGARVYEMGVMITYFVFFAAYAMMDDEHVKKRMQRIQINAAGIESNFFLCGGFLILSALVPLLGEMFFYAAIINGILGLFNLSFIKGLDGTAIISELFGVKDVISRAAGVVFDKRKRKKVVRQENGYATVTVCYILLALQIVLPVVLITNVLEVVACFV